MGESYAVIVGKKEGHNNRTLRFLLYPRSIGTCSRIKCNKEMQMPPSIMTIQAADAAECMKKSTFGAYIGQLITLLHVFGSLFTIMKCRSCKFLPLCHLIGISFEVTGRSETSETKEIIFSNAGSPLANTGDQNL